MRRLDTCLKLVLPRALETQVVDRLLQHPQWVGPFITRYVEGHGDAESIETAEEQVRGRAARMEIEILMEAAHVAELLQDLRDELPSRAVVWWSSPVLDAGSLI
jgi:hypothetical protein